MLVDLNAKTIDTIGAVKFGLVKNGQNAQTFSATRLWITNTGKGAFPIEMENASLVGTYTVGGLRSQVIDAYGLLASGPSRLTITGNQAERKLTWPAGMRLMDGRVNVNGTFSNDANGVSSVAMRGCASGSLPVGGGSHIAELRDACLSYHLAARQWRLDANARVLNSIEANGDATLVDGGLDSLNVSVDSTGKLPMPFGAYLSSGSINVNGLRSGSARFGGSIGGGWPYNPCRSTPR